MVVRKLARRYILARMPDSGPRHHPECDSFDVPDHQTGRSGYTASAITLDAGGMTRVNLDVSLHKRKPTRVAGPARPVERPPSAGLKRRYTTLLGMLHHIWQEVGLNQWHRRMRGKRGWWTVHRFVGEYAETVLVNRERLTDRLYIPEPFDRESRQEQRNRFLDFMRRTAYHDGGEEHYAMILGEVAQCSPTPYGARLDLKHLKEFPLWLHQRTFDQIKRRFARALQVLARPDCTDRLVGLFVVGAGKREGQSYAQEAALMPVTRHWIPVDSHYEAWVADALVDTDRHFVKPLRYDAHEEEVFPDFLLLDAGEQPLPMEIYGFTGNPAYEQRKQEKIAAYRASRQPFWHWDVTATGSGRGAWPTFPSRAGSGSPGAKRSIPVANPGRTAPANATSISGEGRTASQVNHLSRRGTP